MHGRLMHSQGGERGARDSGRACPPARSRFAFCILHFAFCSCLGLLAIPAAGLTPAHGQTNSKEIMALPADKLVEILKNPGAPVFDKAKACQRLAVVGTREAIPALASLLGDEKLNLYARFGLEAIPDPAVDDALREAATKLQGRQLVGVIDSIGQRKDGKAVDLLKGLLANRETAVASAAAGALGRIGTTEAAAVLKEALAKDSPVKNCLGDAGLACAEGLADAGKKPEAIALFESIRAANVAKHIKTSALDGQARLAGSEAKDMVLKLLRSPGDQGEFNLGLALAREVPGAEVTAALADALPTLPAERQALLLRALGDRKDRAPMPAVVAATKSPSPAVREAAIVVLSRLGDASAMGMLLDAALGEGEVAQAAKEGLKTLASPDADKAILDRLAGADAKAKAVLLELAGARRIAAAEATVRRALEDADEQVRLAAIGAMGQLVALKDLDLLIGRALGDAASKQTQAAAAALRTAALRMGDRDACAAKLAERMKGASAEHQAYLLDLLGKVSGKKALEIVVASAKSGDAAMKDAATRVLGEWPNADAAPALLEFAKSDPDAKYQVRALRGYVRIIRQFSLPAEQRVAMCREALAAAQRDDEKRLLLDSLSRFPSPEVLAIATGQLGTASLKQTAGQAAVDIAKSLIKTQPAPVAEAMERVLQAGLSSEVTARAKQLLRQAKKRSAGK